MPTADCAIRTLDEKSTRLAGRSDLQIAQVGRGLSRHGRRHDFGNGGAELEVGRKICARANF